MEHLPQRVDLALFANDAAVAQFAQRIEARKRAEECYADALAIVEVKRVGTDFTPTRSSRDNPSHQIINYLTLTNVPWGILTDGHRWRIYRRFDPPRFDAFLEINLADILAMTDTDKQQESFWWFFAFFSLAAFNHHGQQARLDIFYEGSRQHAAKVQESLRYQAFGVGEELARGIYATTPNQSEANLSTIYEQAIVSLYRLLFLKYAEDRNLLPTHNPLYRSDYGYTSV